VIVPCFNEAATIAEVVNSFTQQLPDCRVIVCDNASTDRTGQAAQAAGATVVHEPRPGKGNAVRRLFADVDADCYLLVDGDSTYDPLDAQRFVTLVDDGIDMVVGIRKTRTDEITVYRRGHRFGNWILSYTFLRLFQFDIQDTLSGYRGLSRRFVKTFPSGATGFEIETDMNVHAASIGSSYAAIDTLYRARPEGSVSKLSTYRDGWRILRRNLRLFRDWRPVMAFSLLSIPWLCLGGFLFWRALADYLAIDEVPKFPSLIAAMACFLIALQICVAGIILERVKRSRFEAMRLAYLAMPAPLSSGGQDVGRKV